MINVLLDYGDFINNIEKIEDVISEVVKAVEQAVTDDEIKNSETALGVCDKFINNELILLEKLMNSLNDRAFLDDTNKSKIKRSLDSIETLSELRSFLAARNAALT